LVQDILKDAGVSNVKAFVDSALPRSQTATRKSNDGAGSPFEFPETVPWSDPVIGTDLLDETVAVIRRHVVMTGAQADAVGLWIGFAYAIPWLGVAPILSINSPAMRCGKTALCSIIHALVPRPLLLSSITPAVLFRLIERHEPTVIADEADTWLRDEHSDLRGVFNAGFTRNAARVGRCSGENLDVRLFSVFAPKVLAMIGRPPSTIRDRSISIDLRRKAASETVQSLRLDRLPESLSSLRRKWQRWVGDRAEQIEQSDPNVPALGSDRAADCWRPLLTIADLVGEHWPERARRSALEVVGSQEPDEGYGVGLLADIRGIFDAQPGADVLGSSDIAARLVLLEDRPWAEVSRGGPLTPAKLARLLKPFGIVGGDYRLPKGVLKGYRRIAFADAWSSYLPEAQQRDK